MYTCFRNTNLISLQNPNRRGKPSILKSEVNTWTVPMCINFIANIVPSILLHLLWLSLIFSSISINLTCSPWLSVLVSYALLVCYFSWKSNSPDSQFWFSAAMLYYTAIRLWFSIGPTQRRVDLLEQWVQGTHRMTVLVCDASHRVPAHVRPYNLGTALAK